jgi:hypothetical protein
VQETAAERAQDIAPEFYPESTSDQSVDESTEATEEDGVQRRICQLARTLGYREVKTRMLLAQWGTNLPGLAAKLQTELDGRFGDLPPEKYCQRGREELETDTSMRRTNHFE